MIRKIYSKLNRFQNDQRKSGSQTLEQRVNNWGNIKAKQHQRIETPLKSSVNHMEKNLRIPTKLKSINSVLPKCRSLIKESNTAQIQLYKEQ